MNDVIEVGDKLYKEANENTRMDTPSYVYEKVNNSNKRRVASLSKLSLYDWYKMEQYKNETDRILFNCSKKWNDIKVVDWAKKWDDDGRPGIVVFNPLSKSPYVHECDLCKKDVEYGKSVSILDTRKADGFKELVMQRSPKLIIVHEKCAVNLHREWEIQVEMEIENLR
jgi:hypothetical protein